jgi:hypothetical protein
MSRDGLRLSSTYVFIVESYKSKVNNTAGRLLSIRFLYSLLFHSYSSWLVTINT